MRYHPTHYGEPTVNSCRRSASIFSKRRMTPASMGHGACPTFGRKN